MTGWAYQHDITGPAGKKGDKGDAASLVDGSILTAHLALSATSEVSAGTRGSRSVNFVDTSWRTVFSVSTASGGAGFRYLATLVVEGAPGLRVRIARGTTALVTDTLGAGSGDRNLAKALTATGSHPAAATFHYQVSSTAGGSYYRSAALTVFIAKR